MPADAARMRSAMVPWGTTSSLILPALNISSNSGGAGRGKLQISLATRPAANSFGSMGEPKPALLETIVSSRAPCAIKPSSSSCGWPTTPKPPKSTTEPSLIPSRACATLSTRLSIIAVGIPQVQLCLLAFWPASAAHDKRDRCDRSRTRLVRLPGIMTTPSNPYADPLDRAFESPSAHSPAPAAEPPYLRGLNAQQREAVLALDGPVLVLAGAGTGKTRVLTTRLAHILATRRAWPSQILAVTFTNKAAREMKERLERMIGEAAEGLWLGTFHSIGARILRRHAEAVGLKPNFTILDADDQLRLVKQIAAADPGRDVANGKGLQLYQLYQERLSALNAADFGDLLLQVLTIFRTRPDIAADYQQRFRYMLVDEYQDTNVAQYLWLRLLAQGHRNLCCVGDDDQSIYGWRGAEVDNILRFERDFPGAQIIRLERNYRSTEHILGAASGLI